MEGRVTAEEERAELQRLLTRAESDHSADGRIAARIFRSLLERCAPSPEVGSDERRDG